MNKPNPHDYPFDYVVDLGPDQRGELQDYRDVIAFVNRYFPDSCIDEIWSNSEDSPFHCFFSGSTQKVIWRNAEYPARLESDRNAIFWDEAFGDPMEELQRRIDEGAIGTIERRRTAYEKAMNNWYCEQYGERDDSEADDSCLQNDDANSQSDWSCPFCAEELNASGSCRTHGDVNDEMVSE